jgi:hypothetical protein
MQKKITLFILLSFLLFEACHKKDMSKNGKNQSAKSGSADKNITAIIKNAIIDPETDLMDKGAAYNIDSLKINGDILSLFINYSGSCKEHSFELYSKGMFAKSLPPQLSLCLRHNSNDDACRELINKELKFNIINLRYPGKNTVILKIGEKQRVTYSIK